MLLTKPMHQELWTFVSTCPAFTHEDLSFCLAGGDKALILRLRSTLESSSRHLAALGLTAIIDHLYSDGAMSSKAKPVISGTSTRSLMNVPSTKKNIRGATGSVYKQKGVRRLEAGASGNQSVARQLQAYKSLATTPKRVLRVCTAVAKQITDRGTNKSLHDECVVCGLFKTRAPPSGLFKSKQYNAIVACHDTSLSAKHRENRILSAFSKWYRPQPKDAKSTEEAMDTVENSSNPPKQPGRSVLHPDNGIKKKTRSEKKEERSIELDNLTVQHQVLEETIRNQRSTLADRTYVDVVKNKVIIPENSLDLKKLLQAKRDVQKKRKTIMSSVIGQKKGKTK